MGETHIAGWRVSVRQVHGLVEERDIDPEVVADRYDLDVGDVYHAPAYYHDHPREMGEANARRERAFENVRASLDRLDGVQSPTS